MNCLCCGKPLKADDSSGWHKSCIKRFFGTSVLPEIEIDNSDMHLKNFSLIETAENSGEYILSPAYDSLPVNVIMGQSLYL